ncbi:MAG: DUF4932 domain-containing protein [bacterium]
MARYLLLVCLVICSCSDSSVKNQSSKIKVCLNPSTELVCILFYLGGNAEYNDVFLQSYKSDVDKAFLKFKDSPTVKYTSQLSKTQEIAYDGPMSYAVHLTDELTPKVPFDPLPIAMDVRWTAQSATEFQLLVRQFADDTKFFDFYKLHAEKYKSAIDEISQKINTEVKMEWFDDFYRTPTKPDYTVIISLWNGRNNYGVKTTINGKESLYSIIGANAGENEKPILHKSAYATIIHEFSHSYCNPLVDKHLSEFDRSGQKLFKKFMSGNHQMAYDNWVTIWKETLVRACVICYLKEQGNFISNMFINNKDDAMAGFPWTEDLADNIRKNYVDNPKYPNFESYLPEIIKFMEKNY